MYPLMINKRINDHKTSRQNCKTTLRPSPQNSNCIPSKSQHHVHGILTLQQNYLQNIATTSQHHPHSIWARSSRYTDSISTTPNLHDILNTSQRYHHKLSRTCWQDANTIPAKSPQILTKSSNQHIHRIQMRRQHSYIMELDSSGKQKTCQSYPDHNSTSTNANSILKTSQRLPNKILPAS